MDRRSWLWRRKSSEKSPGETESSGSASSHSERFSDDQLGELKLGELLETPPPGLDEAIAISKALDWLKSYYWEPQKKAIPFQSDGIGSLRKEIKYRL